MNSNTKYKQLGKVGIEPKSKHRFTKLKRIPSEPSQISHKHICFFSISVLLDGSTEKEDSGQVIVNCHWDLRENSEGETFGTKGARGKKK